MIEDVLSNLGGDSRLTSEERLACQQAHDELHRLASEVTRMSSAEKHLRLFVEKVSTESRELIEDMYHV